MSVDPGKHRAQPGGRRRAAPPGKRRADVRPRYGRIAIFTASIVVTGVAVLGGFGLLPNPQDASAASGSLTPSSAAERMRSGADAVTAADTRSGTTGTTPQVERRAEPAGSTPVPVTSVEAPALPDDSGAGRRIVFSESAQRVWLVDSAGRAFRTYLVSGSATDNLDPGTYQVYSRSRHAVGIDASGTMEYFVRFTQGDAGAAIGFHTIPVDDGAPIQTIAQLGTPLSHGCIRQRTSDAVALWRFAPIGTTVVVTA